jgi:dihydroxyacid dehydratase/phosphogluconate dehydratase
LWWKLRHGCLTPRTSLQDAFKAGELDGDFVAVVRFQGPKANGMPELHKLTPPLGVLQDRGQAVALVTDGRMSGASGKVPAAIHVTPEAKDGGPIAKIRDGDMIRLDAVTGTLEVLVPAEEFDAREPATADLSQNEWGLGRELFARLRDNAGPPMRARAFSTRASTLSDRRAARPLIGRVVSLSAAFYQKRTSMTWSRCWGWALKT